MPELEAKLHREIDTDTYVVACRFPFPTWIPDSTFGSGVDAVWLYRNPMASINNKTIEVELKRKQNRLRRLRNNVEFKNYKN